MKKQNKSWGATLVLMGAIAAVAGASASQAAIQAGASALRIVDGPALKQAVKAQKGKVVVLNVWATWCSPCVEEFPSLVKLDSNYRSKNVVVLAASVDEPSDRQKVTEFLTEQKVVFPVYLRSKGEMEPFVQPVDKKWDGGVPITYVFSRSGKLVGKPLLGKQTYEKLEAVVNKALAK